MGFGSLDIALTGLSAAQRQISVISDNISNVNTPGHTRKILPQETQVLNGEGAGVRTSNIIRRVDLDLTRDFWTQTSTVKALDVKATYLDRIQQFHGQPDEEISVAAELGNLRDSFSALSDSPEDTFLQRSVIDQAEVFADKTNDLADLINTLRNDAQGDLETAVIEVNELLENIAELNRQIKLSTATGRTTAALEDQRDEAIKALADEMEVSFFTRSDGVLVVQTNRGVQLADERAETVFFDDSQISFNNFYPQSPVNGLFVGGDPNDVPTAIEITSADLNGRIGALIELRDDILPRQQALVDEMAHQLARRFQAQGLTLFTDSSGQVRNDTAPDPSTDPPTPVEYVGFANEIQVNQAIIDNNALLQQGTVGTDDPIQSGSNEVIRRVVDFVFDDTQFQQALGTVDLSAAGLGVAQLQEGLNLFSENTITGTSDLGSFSSLGAVISAGGSDFDPPNDQFEITFVDRQDGTPAADTTITVDISALAADGTIAIGQPDAVSGGTIDNAADQLANGIQNAITAATPPALLSPQVRVTSFGQLVIESRGEIQLDASGVPNALGTDGLQFLGFTEGSFQPTHPSFQVQVGNDPAVTIEIDPADTAATLFDKLDNDGSGGDQGVAGLAVDPELNGGGPPERLRLRPGDDFNNQSFGGDLRIVGGPFETTGGTPILEALFGASDPVTDVSYSSLDSSGNPVPFRTTELGPGAAINTGIISSSDILDYSQKMVSRQTEDSIINNARFEDQESFRQLLQDRLLDDSGVNIDEELSNLIRMQNAFSAATRVVQAIDEQFRELLNAV